MPLNVSRAASTQDSIVHEVTLSNGRGTEAKLLSFGATLKSLIVSGDHGGPVDLVLGFDTVDDYATKPGHLGATVGRFANRIAHGRFTLDGHTYELPKNQGGKHQLHGGPRGFAHRVWDIGTDEAGTAVRFAIVSPDGDNGYPGRVEASCIYRLTDEDVLSIEMMATADAPTPVNLVNHSYWNLGGSGTIDHHRLLLSCDNYLEVDEDTVPTGRIFPVEGTELDFVEEKPLDFAGPPEIDTCLVVRGQGLRHVATLTDPVSGRRLELVADQPGVQVYTAPKLNLEGRGGQTYGPRAAICLETQAFPDAPNKPDFPSAILRPGQTYRHHMECRLSRA